MKIFTILTALAVSGSVLFSSTVQGRTAKSRALAPSQGTTSKAMEDHIGGGDVAKIRQERELETSRRDGGSVDKKPKDRELEASRREGGRSVDKKPKDRELEASRLLVRAESADEKRQHLPAYQGFPETVEIRFNFAEPVVITNIDMWMYTNWCGITGTSTFPRRVEVPASINPEVNGNLLSGIDLAAPPQGGVGFFQQFWEGTTAATSSVTLIFLLRTQYPGGQTNPPGCGVNGLADVAGLGISEVSFFGDIAPQPTAPPTLPPTEPTAPPTLPPTEPPMAPPTPQPTASPVASPNPTPAPTPMPTLATAPSGPQGVKVFESAIVIPGNVNYAGAAAYCDGQGLSLCSYDDLCPNGIEESPVVDVFCGSSFFVKPQYWIPILPDAECPDLNYVMFGEFTRGGFLSTCRTHLGFLRDVIGSSNPECFDFWSTDGGQLSSEDYIACCEPNGANSVGHCPTPAPTPMPTLATVPSGPQGVKVFESAIVIPGNVNYAGAAAYCDGQGLSLCSYNDLCSNGIEESPVVDVYCGTPRFDLL